jgi:tetratricopeptide (TPR) repeat protein
MNDHTLADNFQIPVLFLYTIAACVFLVSLPLTTRAAEVRITADAQFDYAHTCLRAQNYDCAIAEFRRFTHFFPNDDRVPEALLQMGRAQLLANQPAQAVVSFEALIRRFEQHPLAVQAAFLKAEAWMRQQAHLQAILTLNNLIQTTPDQAVQDRARFRIAWIHVDRGDWPAARSALNMISPAHQGHYQTRALLADLDGAANIPTKSPTLAGSLSVLPGLGQLYCERYEDAIIALLVNGGLIWASVEAFNHDLYALGGVIGFVELGFYAGNIYGAVGDAHKYNRRATRAFSNGLTRKWRVGMLPAPQKDGIGLLLQFDY